MLILALGQIFAKGCPHSQMQIYEYKNKKAPLEGKNKEKKEIRNAMPISNPALVFAVLREAVPAVNRPSFGRLERNFAFLPAVGADCLVHLAGATVVTATAASAIASASAAIAAASAASSSAVSAAVVVFKSHLFHLFFSFLFFSLSPV
jgi:hypothetical protein